MDSRTAAATDCFVELGLTDAVVTQLGTDGVAVLTDDFELYWRIAKEKKDAINFNHLRNI